MRKTILFVLFNLLIIVSCQKKENNLEKKTDFNALVDRYYEERLKLFPLDATSNGDNRYNDILPNDITEEYRNNLKSFYSSYLDSLASINKASLSEEQQLSFEILTRELNVGLEGLKFNDHYLPIQQMWGTALTLPQFGSGQSNQPFKTVKDYDDFLGRIKGFTFWADTAIVNMRKGLEAGQTFPKVLMEKVLPQFEAMFTGDIKKNIFYLPITNLPDSFNSGDKERLTEAYTKAIKEEIIPSYRKLHEFLKNEYIPKTRTTTGFADITGGKERYEYLIKYWTTTDLSADEIFETGLKEVARIRGEMEKIKDQVGFNGDLKAFFEYVTNDKKFMSFKKDEEIISGFKKIEETMQPQLSKLFKNVPKTRFEVRQTEEFREASASAEYFPGTPDGTRPGIFYVPILDPVKFNYTGMETLFLHEAIPGHHYQISLQQENENLPKFRRFLWYGAYGEGWALYSESLGKELGLYKDPYQYFGNMGDEIHRAIRLVVDVGMHAKGWTREKALQYMLDNEAISEEAAIAEIERYMAVPGQALSYKIGQLKIIELRKKAESELGTKFDLAAYHDEVLKDGCLPLDVFEKKINKWIDKQKQA
jgi:uncharacterized protein (DUF885 family)